MADSLSKAAGEGVTVELKGTVFKIMPLTIGDLSNFESFLRSKKIQDFRAAAEDMAKDERVSVLSKLASETLDEVEIGNAMRSMTGIQYLMWRSLRKSHPELEYDDMEKYIDLQNFDEVIAIVEGIGGNNEEENPTEPPPPETA